MAAQDWVLAPLTHVSAHQTFFDYRDGAGRASETTRCFLLQQLTAAVGTTRKISAVQIDYCALRGPDLYAILYEDRRALFLAHAEEDDSIVRLIDALDDAVLSGCSRVRRSQGSVSSKSSVRF